MTDQAFAILQRLYNGESTSRADQDNSLEGLSTSDRNRLAEAFEFIIAEKFLTSTDPNNSNYHTKYVISEVGKTAFDRHKERRDIAWRLQSQEQKTKDLQLDLLEANIRMVESVISANTAAENNYKWQRKNGNRTIFFIAVSAFFSLASIVTTFALQDKQTPQLLKKQVQILDSISIFQKGIESSFRKAVADSFYRKN
jgi:hypothetical protein